MSYRNQGYRGEGEREQWGQGGGRGGGGGRQQRGNHQDHYRSQHDPSRQDNASQAQSWPRQQQLPNKQGSSSWNRHNNHPNSQQRTHQGWQKNDGPRKQQNNRDQGQFQKQQQQRKPQPQQQQQPQKPREFKPPPPRPNAWGAPPPGREQQQSQTPQPPQTQHPPQEKQQKTPTNDTSVTPQENASTSETVPGAMGAWTTKFNSKKTSPAANKGPSVRGQKVAPVILKKDSAAAPPSKKPKNKHHQANKKDNAKTNKANNNNNNTNNNKIHGKKPKLTNISMGDLVPKIKKIIPNKKGDNPSTQAQTHPQQVLQGGKQNESAAASDFPALPTASNWPSLAAAKPPASPKKASNLPKQSTPNNTNKTNNNKTTSNNNNQSKKRKNQTQQQSQDTKKGGAKSKGGNNNLLVSSTATLKLDENHLAAQFLLPPGKSLDPAHLQAQIGGGTGTEHDLMRMMKGGQVVVKGRQRIKPRKKRFTALKRKILLERLRVWKELHPELDPDKRDQKDARGSEASCTICVYGFASLEEVEDADEYEELLENLKDMADKVGKVRHVFIPTSSVDQDGKDESEREHPAFVHFSTTAEAMAARGVWDGLVIGGQALRVRSLAIAASIDTAMEDRDEGQDTEESAWQQACLDAERGPADAVMEDVDATTCRILLKDVLTEDDLEDDECFAESIQDIKQLVEKFGVVEDVQARKQEGSRDIVIVYKGNPAVAQTAKEELQQLTLGGSQLLVEILPSQAAQQRPVKLLLEDVLTDDDLEDEECLEESLNDVRSLLEKFGPVAGMDTTGTQITVAFDGMSTEALKKIVSDLGGTCLGGQTIKASLILESPTNPEDNAIVLRNLLTADDLEDDDCLQESLEDVRELAGQSGTVHGIEVEKGDDVASSVVKIVYSTLAEAESAMKHFDGMIVGGETISASMSVNSSDAIADNGEAATSDNDDKAATGEDGEPKPMFSGDKRIPERFAACKRVPKVPNKGTPRNYALLTNNDTVKPLLLEMLAELMRLQLRALHSQNAKNSKARRRIVIGLREVARGIRANKVKMVVMANNLDEYGAIDDKLQEILDLAAEKEIPVLFELSKRVLGKALTKNIKVSVCAIQTTDGAHQQFVKLAALAPHLEKPPVKDEKNDLEES